MHGCLLYTERAPRWQQFHWRGTSHVTSKQCCKQRCIYNLCCMYTASVSKVAVTSESLIENHADKSAVSLLESREYRRCLKAISISAFQNTRHSERAGNPAYCTRAVWLEVQFTVCSASSRFSYLDMLIHSILAFHENSLCPRCLKLALYFVAYN